MIDVFPARLKYAREKANLLQKDVARRCNISSAAYSLYESGKREPSYDFIIAFSQACNVSSDFLLGLSDYADIEHNGSDSFGKRLRLIRESHKLSIKDVAQKFNIAQTTIYRYEQGSREPTVAYIRDFCCLCDISADFLLCLSNMQSSFAIKDPYGDLSPEHLAALDALADFFRRQESTQDKI